MKRLISCGMILMLLVLGVSPALAKKMEPGDFTDVQGHWAQKDISVVCNLGFMNGMGANERGYKVFCPDNLVNQAQLALVLQNIFELDYGQNRLDKQPLASDYYQDVDSQAWYADAVTLCTLNQVFDAADNFYPEKAVTRIEAARAIYRCVNAKGLSIPMIMLMPDYRDMEGLSQEDTNALVFTSNTGLMKGDGQYWRPEDNIKRAELARIVNSLVQLLGVDESYDGQEYSLKAGNSFTLRLNSNPTTGYRWTASYDDKMLALIGNDYQQDGNGNLVGQGGQDIWRFKALQAGTAEIKMTYSRPWESAAPIKTFTLKVIIPSQTEAGPVQVTGRVIKEKSDIIEIDLNIPVVSGQLESGIQSVINKRFEDEAMELKQSLEAEVRDYAADCEREGYPIRPYQLYTRYEQCSLNDQVLSLYVDYYQYTGGAHGITERRAYNIDLKTGELLPLAELFEPGYDYKAVIDQEIKRQIALEPEAYFEGDMGFKGINKEQGYYLDGDSLVIYFNQYEIAPYAGGIREFKMPLKGVTSSQPVVTTDWEPTTYEIVNNLAGVTMIPKEGTASAAGLVVVLENNSGAQCIYGEHFGLEKKIKGNWYQVPVIIEGNYGFDDIGYDLVSGENREWAVDWDWLYGSLEPGEYRIVKDISDFRGSGDYDTYYLAAEFTIH